MNKSFKVCHGGEENKNRRSRCVEKTPNACGVQRILPVQRQALFFVVGL